MTEFERMQAFSYLDGVADGLKESRNDVIEELEKIREEIKANRDEWIKGQDAEWHTYDRCIHIIDNHIEELKGEQE